MFSIDEIFVGDMDDLRRILADPTDRNLLTSAGILRRLLLDGGGLVHKVNASRRLPLRFERSMVGDVPDFMREAELFWLSAAPRSESKQTMKLQEFLASEGAHVSSGTMSVRDVIDYFANKAGSVHFGPTSDPRASDFASIGSFRLDHEQRSGMKVLHGILEVCWTGMLPLYHAVKTGSA